MKKGPAPAKGYDALIYPVIRQTHLEKLVDASIAQYASQEKYEGNFGEWLLIPLLDVTPTKKIAFLGLGDKRQIDEDVYRRFGGQLAKRVRDARLQHVAVTLDASCVVHLSAREVMRAIAEGFFLGSYVFHAYHSEQAEKHQKHQVKEMHFYVENASMFAAMQRGLDDAAPMVAGVHLTRDLVNTPSKDMGPLDMARIAEDIGKLSKRIKVKQLDRERMEKLQMHAALSVAQGSAAEPCGVHMVYTPEGAAKRRIAIVGKAVTFDSGGLSIKPADGMMTMKMDMAGGAAVLGVFRALAHLEIHAEVHGIFLAVENMPSGHAYRPGDVVKAMDGTTIEILNTDAEGRVTLADALLYAKQQEPDIIIDLATLTGACVVALGEEIAGAMGTDRKLIEKLSSIGSYTGEMIWELPLHPSYEEHVKSKIAQLKNIGARGQAGAIAGGWFLRRFVGQTPWVHLDIAGPAYAEREARPDTPAGGTGFGVRMLVRYLQSF